MIKLDYSRYKTFKSCSKQYELDLLETPVTRNMDRLKYSYLFGTVMDQLATWLFNGYVCSEGIMLEDDLYRSIATKPEWKKVVEDFDKQLPVLAEDVPAADKEEYLHYKTAENQKVVIRQYREKNGIHKILEHPSIQDSDYLAAIIEKMKEKAINILHLNAQGIPLGQKYMPKTIRELEREVLFASRELFKNIFKFEFTGEYAKSQVSFLKRAGPVRLKGKLDLLVLRKTQQGLVYKIIDFKSRKKKSPPDKTQLVYYVMILSFVENQNPVQAGFYYFVPGSFQPVTVTFDETKKLFDDIIETSKKIEEGQFYTNPGNHCFWCLYNDQCQDAKVGGVDGAISKKMLETDSSISVLPGKEINLNDILR